MALGPYCCDGGGVQLDGHAQTVCDAGCSEQRQVCDRSTTLLGPIF
jgi:hypothetical protein